MSRGYIGNYPDATPFDLSPFYAAMRGRIGGLALSNNGSDATNDIDIAVGGAMDSTNAAWMALDTGLTKQLDAAWAAGTNQGGLDTGSIANDTYHVFLIKNPSTGVVDALFSTSPTSPTMPSGYTLKRRIGSIVRTGGAIKAFKQFGDFFRWVTPVEDINQTGTGTSAVTRTLTLPTDIVVIAHINVSITTGATADGAVLVTALDETDTDPAAVRAGQAYVAAASANGPRTDTFVKTNTSAQVRSRDRVSNQLTAITTLGWIDRRGQDD